MEEITLQNVTLQKITVQFPDRAQLIQLLKNEFFSQNQDFENRNHSEHIEWWFTKCRDFTTHCPGHKDMYVRIKTLRDGLEEVGSQITFTLDADNSELVDKLTDTLKTVIGEGKAKAIIVEGNNAKRFTFEIAGSKFIEIFREYYLDGSLTLGHARDIVYKLKHYNTATDHSPVSDAVVLKYNSTGGDDISFQVTIENGAAQYDVNHLLELMSLKVARK